jgi:XRE family aerobic/anaerobic benzoate catabolism transcriptional regulator
MAQNLSKHGRRLARLGQEVKALREDQGWTRRELSARSGLSVRFLADIENGLANPSLIRLWDLAETLGIPAEDLLATARRDPGQTKNLRLALLGLRGAGKTTLGTRLSQQLDIPFIELDTLVEEEAGMPIPEIFELQGEAAYRILERRLLSRLLNKNQDLILAVSGGLVTDPRSYALLRQQTKTIWLKARPIDHWNRVRAQGDLRPMEGRERAYQDLVRLLEQREPLYRQAGLTIDTSEKPIDAVVGEVLEDVLDKGRDKGGPSH